jgi:hypothetical protein
MNITADSDLIQQLAQRMPGFFGGGVAPATQKAFTTSARYIQRVWKGWAMGDPIEGIPDIKNPSQKLANSIKMNPVGPFIVDIITESPHMRRIVDGTPRVDMKETYPYGRKSRVSEEGIPYLIIPFRWGTPNKSGGKRAHFGNVIPQPMYEMIKAMNMKKSVKTANTHIEENYSGDQIERAEYVWGDRLEAEGNENGMVRMASETRGGGSTYFTFRIISAKSPAGSWIRKAIPPVDVEGALSKTVTPVVEKMINSALEVDIGLK